MKKIQFLTYGLIVIFLISGCSTKEQLIIKTNNDVIPIGSDIFKNEIKKSLIDNDMGKNKIFIVEKKMKTRIYNSGTHKKTKYYNSPILLNDKYVKSKEITMECKRVEYTIEADIKNSKDIIIDTAFESLSRKFCREQKNSYSIEEYYLPNKHNQEFVKIEKEKLYPILVKMLSINIINRIK